jgi:hypothetical protein
MKNKFDPNKINPEKSIYIAFGIYVAGIVLLLLLLAIVGAAFS